MASRGVNLFFPKQGLDISEETRHLFRLRVEGNDRKEKKSACFCDDRLMRVAESAFRLAESLREPNPHQAAQPRKGRFSVRWSVGELSRHLKNNVFVQSGDKTVGFLID